MFKLFRNICVGKLGNNSMINSRIFSMTNAATNMLNTNILDVLSNMNSSKIHANISIANSAEYIARTKRL